MIDEFFRTNYFIQPRTVECMLKNSDDKPVTKPSILYTVVMNDNFKL